MLQRHTSSRTKKSRQRMLSLKVSSPRIVFLDFLKVGTKAVKYSLLVALMVGVGAILNFGWQKLFVENEEFTINELPLKTFDGKEPRFLSHERIVKKAGLDPQATIFAIDADELRAALEQLPELTSAKVSRRLPGTLKIEVAEREPVAWIACPALGIRERDRELGLLVDRDGIAFQCASDALWAFAQKLPVLTTSAADSEQIVERQPVSDKGLQYALKLIELSSSHLADDQRLMRIEIKDEIILEAKTIDGISLTFSFYDLERQVSDFSDILAHAQYSGRELKKINLIPRRFVPVQYQRNL